MTHNCKIHFRASNFYRQITNGPANLAPPKVQVASRQSAIAYGRVLRGISRSWTGSQRCQGGQMVSRQTDRQTGRPPDVAQSAHSQGARCRWPMPQAINHLNMPKKTYIIILAKAKIMRERPDIMIIDNWAVAGEQQK